MDSNVATALVSGIFSIVSAFGAVYLKEYLDYRKASAHKPLQRTAPVPDVPLSAEMPLIKAPVPTARVAISIRRPIVIVVGSFLLGVVTRTSRDFMRFGSTHLEVLMALVVLIGLAIAFAMFHRRRSSQPAFQLENLALWSAYSSGWSLIHGGIWSDFVVVHIPWWLGCCVVGGLVVSFRRTRDSQPGAGRGA